MDYTIADKYVGKVFNIKRNSLNMTLEETANKLRIPRGTYYYYETGRRSMPFDIYKKACKIYGLNYIELFEKAQKEIIKAIKK